MTIMVRNEADVIEDNLRFHRAQGVDFFIALDNGSTDGTREILESYERAGILRLVSMPGPLLKVLKKGTTQMGRMAHEMGADWVIHNDADEFWWPLTGTNLKEALAAIPNRFGMLLAPRTEFLPRPDGAGSFAERLVIREARFRRPPKTAHRAHPLIKLWTTHPIDVWVNRGSSPRGGLVGKPALRAQPTHVEENELDLVLAPEFPIGVLHFPFRSFEQYRSKVEVVDDNHMFDRSAEAREIRKAYESRPTRGRVREPDPRSRRRSARAWPRAGWWRTPSFATTSSPAPGSSRRQSRRLEPARGPRSDAGQRWRSSERTGCMRSAATCRPSPPRSASGTGRFAS